MTFPAPRGANQVLRAKTRAIASFRRTPGVARANRLELTFQTSKLREICETRSVAVAELGYAAARELADRLADIEAIDTVTELAQLVGEAIQDRTAIAKSLRLESGFDIVFVSGHPTPPETGLSIETDWKTTTRVKITAIDPVND